MWITGAEGNTDDCDFNVNEEPGVCFVFLSAPISFLLMCTVFTEMYEEDDDDEEEEKKQY